MNRRERKQMEKSLGISKHVKSLSREARFERMKNNQATGRKTHQEFTEKNKSQQLAIQEEKESNSITNIAENIAKRKSIPFIDAMEEAKIEYNKSK